MEMVDMGSKMGETLGVKIDKNKIQYPSLRLDKAMSELKGKDIGDMCRLEIVGKIISKSESDRNSSIEIEVQKVGYIGKAGKLTKDEYINKSQDEREQYDKEQVEENAQEENSNEEDTKDDNEE